jgi:heat shock protein beta
MIRNKHSVFSSAFPIYLFTQRTEQVPDDEVVDAPSAKTQKISGDTETNAKPADDEEVIVEDVAEDSEKTSKMKIVTVDEWRHLNSQPPLWMRCILSSFSFERLCS